MHQGRALTDCATLAPLAFHMGCFHVTSSLPCWWTKTKDLSLSPFVRLPAIIHFLSQEIGCKPSVQLAASRQRKEDDLSPLTTKNVSWANDFYQPLLSATICLELKTL